MKDCITCKFLEKFTSLKGFINACTAEEPDEVEDGLFLILAIDLNEYDPSECLLYKEK